jgi:hypothetical protein
MRTCLLALLVALLGASAQAQSLQVKAKFGYLSEYELSANVAAQPSDHKSFSGPMIIRHVGICSHNGPNEEAGQISLRLADANSRVSAMLVFDGHKCTFAGRLSKTEIGEMTCPGSAVPFSMWSN